MPRLKVHDLLGQPAGISPESNAAVIQVDVEVRLGRRTRLIFVRVLIDVVHLDAVRLEVFA